MSAPDWLVWVMMASVLGGLVAFVHYGLAFLVMVWRFVVDAVTFVVRRRSPGGPTDVAL